ncbi:MAG TPA: glycoside hydrolase family 88 protein [Verrucomicrobiae bacterium]|nr:glycoside hydrolase family 88 protein [Verrucomicrobiae bacterium]
MNQPSRILQKLIAALSVLIAQAALAAPSPAQVPTALHRMPPKYPVPYGPTNAAAITEVLQRIHGYLEANTPIRVVNRETGAEITDFSQPDRQATVERGHFPIISYEWGVTYSGMLLAAETTGDSRFTDYVSKRLKFIAARTQYFRALDEAGMTGERNPFRAVLHPGALDDAGSMCAAMIKAGRAGLVEARPLVDHWADYVFTKQFRLEDGTLARKRPMMNSLWLDDLYMGVPALAQMGSLTGDARYFDDAVKQIRQFSQRMFNRDLGVYMHGWIAGMSVHPEFRWARANGWALLAKTELLDALPENHPGRAFVLDLFRAHVRGLASYQGHNGLWHQLLDRNDSYLETSASAIYTYCIAHAINRGWIDPLAYGPMVLLSWNAVSTKVNAAGQVEEVCVGTGMGFDPAFYYYRPTSVFAAHGYGPVLLAGAEMIRLIKSDRAVINDSAVQFDRQPADMRNAH